jgi:phosphopantothenoylcysteine decarboxylase/phosphopantothenate--cysteine ligase
VAKAQSKGVDVLVANDVLATGSGFGTVTNEVTVIMPDGTLDPWPLVSKAEVAARLWDLLADLRAERGR